MAAAFSSSSSSSSSFILFVIITTLLVFTSISSSPAASVTTKLPQIEVDALKEIGDKLEKAWNFSVDPCSGNAGWATEGLDSAFANNLTCDCSYSNGTVCHVVSILLKSQNLTGVLPEELAKLTHLHTFDIARNYINGTIPPEWASLPLVNLSIMANRVTGKIPKELGNISTLERLVLENNQLEGTLPEELGNLGNLTRLIIGSNKLTGELPTSFGRLTNLTILWLDDNNFTGKIPDFIANWKQLQLLMILGTLMEGPIPSNISLLEQLTELRIADLKGPVSRFPPLENLKNLDTLVLRNCSLAGEIPSYIGGMTNLKMLDLSFNNLTGEIPQSFGRLSHLVFMFLKSNQLTGFLPSWILSSMGNMDLSINNFSYVNHQETCPQGNLNLVGFSSTNDNITGSCRRRGFPCRGIPKYYSLFINCGGAQTIVNGNKYEADLEQRGASMFFNGVRGNWAVTSTGKFMGEGNDKNSYIARSTSSLFIADQSLYSTARRSAISLTYYGVCLQNGNYNVKLHFAEIEFTNDTTWCSLGKRLFDVYIQHYLVLKDFNIEDEAHGVGRELIRSFNAVVSTNTLQIDFYWAGKGTTAIPSRGFYGPLVSAISVTPNFKPIDYDQQSTRVLTWQIILIIGTCCLIIVLISVILHQKIRGKEAIDKELRGLGKQTSLFSLKQIKSATGDFDPSNKIGEGGFGPVYKGTLPDGSEIAVKQLSSRSRQGNREFLAEIGMISAVKHPNVVKLLGCCIEGNQLMLVYEFMVNNSLARALFVADEERIKLDWTTRFKIGMGIARGLAYLHEESAMKVVHRDIKATNILLDKDLNAKISDFGLAKLDEGDTTHISTRIAGTIGYMAPEYATRGYLTDKADVYSFGVVILELVSGKNNANWVPSNDYAFLLDWAYVLLEKGNLLDLVDPSLNSNFSREEALRMLNVALLCTSPSPTLRPSMKTVLKMIEGRAEIQPASSRTRTSLFSTYGYESSRERSQDTERYTHQITHPLIDSSESVSVVSDGTNSGVVTRSSN